MCGADREIARGLCGAEQLPRIAKIMLHAWEEPFISGTRGSGAVFFSGCNLGCVYCQNHTIRDGGVGESYDVEALARAFLRLQKEGAVADAEMWRTFNCGIGFVFVVPASAADAVSAELDRMDLAPRTIGRVVEAGDGDERVRIG